MTRINCVDPQELSNPHLIVEMKEITRVYPLSWKAYQRGLSPKDFPQEYCLGTGHVSFFYPRLGYIDKRQQALCKEMARRGFVVPLLKRWPWVQSDPRRGFLGITLRDWPNEWKQDWEPDHVARQLNRQRLKERMDVINSYK